MSAFIFGECCNSISLKVFTFNAAAGLCIRLSADFFWSLLKFMDEATIKTPIPKCRLYWCFCLGWCSNFVYSESGQKQSVKLLQNMVYNTTQHPYTPLPPQPHTVCMYCMFTLRRVGGMGEVREEVEGQKFTRGVENTNMTDCFSSL
jgi:hypothetical protein